MKIKIVGISFHSTIGHLVIQIEVVSKIGGMFVRGQLKNISYPGNLMSKAKKNRKLVILYSVCRKYMFIQVILVLRM